MPSVYYSSQVSTRSRDAAAHEHENGPAVSFNFYTWDSALYIHSASAIKTQAD